ncbi:hypothetical protein R1flu_014808 [Riccia fluitans]|uniref:C3H1-type domain-containing protein n=1 Tax=Riccia fluitans TaxID=41844 RepID=A0ABD1YHB1_9MARC
MPSSAECSAAGAFFSSFVRTCKGECKLGSLGLTTPTVCRVTDMRQKFHDTPASRKRHMQGILHQRAVKAWYDRFRDTEQDGGRRGVCTYFQRTGTCHYGSNCYYLHLTPPNFYAPVGMSDPNVSNIAVGLSPVPPPSPPPPPPGKDLAESQLPPSLRPPPEEGYPPMPFVDWG